MATAALLSYYGPWLGCLEFCSPTRGLVWAPLTEGHTCMEPETILRSHGCVCVWRLLPLGFTEGEGPSDPPTGVGMQLDPGRNPCHREATVTTLPKTDPVWLGGRSMSAGEELHHYGGPSECAAQSTHTQPNDVRALHLRGLNLNHP